MRLLEYIQSNGLTISGFARIANLPVSTVYRAATGAVIPSRRTMKIITEVSGGAVTPASF